MRSSIVAVLFLMSPALDWGATVGIRSSSGLEYSGNVGRTSKGTVDDLVFRTIQRLGISERALERHYLRACRRLSNDNRIGKLIFAFSRRAQKTHIARRAILRMTEQEQTRKGYRPRMSGVLWDMFSGSAPYADILRRSLHPVFLGRLLWCVLASLWPSRRAESGAAAAGTGPASAGR